jgi:hypothetical protein
MIIIGKMSVSQIMEIERRGTVLWPWPLYGALLKTAKLCKD